jgi:hypothetical protein
MRFLSVGINVAVITTTINKKITILKNRFINTLIPSKRQKGTATVSHYSCTIKYAGDEKNACIYELSLEN